MAFSFNGPSRIISITSGTTEISIRDLWSRWVDWFLTSDNSKYFPAFEQVGGNTISESDGTYIPIYVFLKNSWRIRPQEASHTLNVKDGVIIVEGGGDPFINTISSYNIRINYSQPVQAITVSTGGGSGLTLGQIESSTVLAKESTIVDSTKSIKNLISALN